MTDSTLIRSMLTALFGALVVKVFGLIGVLVMVGVALYVLHKENRA